MTLSIQILDEQPHHYDEVRQVTMEAFASSEFGHHGEAELVAMIRQCRSKHLSLVAADGRQVVGHILFSPAVIQSESSTFSGMALGPMAVLPPYQRRGIGSALVTAGLRRLDEQHTPFVVVFGHPSYYPRFGFVPASSFGLKHGFAGLPQELLFVRCLPIGFLSPGRGGQIWYDSAFGPQFEDH